MRASSMKILFTALGLFALGTTVFASEVSIVRDPAPLIADEVVITPQVSGDRATYEGTLRVYLVEPISRWADDLNQRFENGLLDFTAIDVLSIPDGGTYYSIEEWAGSANGYGNITEDNIMAIGVVFNAEDTVLDAYPGYGYWFNAHFADGAAAATPLAPGANVSDAPGYTHTVFIEEGTATW